MLFGRVDLRLETSSAAEFAANTEKDEGWVPEVLVPIRPPLHDVEWAPGVPASDIAGLIGMVLIATSWVNVCCACS